MKIVVVEDDLTVAEELEVILESNGYEVQLIKDFTNVLMDIKTIEPDLVLLDINLPHQNGFELCKQLRIYSKDLPIIMVTSRDCDMDELKGIVIGADDYITKPYNIPVLLARIGLVLRKSKSDQSNTRLEVKGVVLNVDKAILEYNGNKIDLTKTEFRILNYLFKRPGKIISRADLIDNLWDYQVYVDDNALSIHINRIRKKLKDEGIENFIITKHGQGYMI
ncbi:response regulator transcription factor [Haloimpatiens sp. FM7330]|uniref:response regulator transcription factor n=1 Tax=Haloimpatiens sp. FM7330 TaxID=3298610 RepID=UPI00363A4CA9